MPLPPLPTKTNKISVSIDTQKPPNFHFNPHDVDADHNHKVEWVKDEKPPKGYNTHFKFAAVAFPSSNPFANVVVKDDNISADHRKWDPEGLKYSVLVSVGAAASPTYFSSLGQAMTAGGDPTIRNH